MVSVLLPGKRGRPVGTLAIPESVENIIEESEEIATTAGYMPADLAREG
jgi:hypothetical protein